MLTCKVGEKIINTFEYDDEQIRKWSNKGILKCPVCNSDMIYRHGEIKIAHFAHNKEADCIEYYSEPETEEHVNGKKIIYEWLKDQDNINNLKLEAWIPETKQRPDIYFEMENNRYVIEFQCTPIATEYLQRHRLYELAGIKDIWMLGTQKYNISVTSLYVTHNTRLKTIEKYAYYYLDVNTEDIIINKNVILSNLKHKELKLDNYYSYNLRDVYFDSNKHQISPSKTILNKLIEKDNDEYLLVKERRIAEEQRKREERLIKQKEQEQKFYIIDKCNILIRLLNEKYRIVNEDCVFNLSDSNSEYYLCKIVFNSKNIDYTFFIKANKTDCCIEVPYNKEYILGGRGKRGGVRKRYYPSTKYINQASLSYKEFNVDNLKTFMCDIISTSLRRHKYGTYANIKEE